MYIHIPKCNRQIFFPRKVTLDESCLVIERAIETIFIEVLTVCAHGKGKLVLSKVLLKLLPCLFRTCQNRSQERSFGLPANEFVINRLNID